MSNPVTLYGPDNRPIPMTIVRTTCGFVPQQVLANDNDPPQGVHQPDAWANYRNW